MLIIQAVVLGFVQGLSELLPISSSGHLIITSQIFNWPDQGLAFDAVIHLGTLMAVVVLLRRDLIDIFFKKTSIPKQGWKFAPDWRWLNIILLAILPALVVGFLFGDQLEAFGRRVDLVALNLIFWGVVLWLAERVSKKQLVNYNEIDSKQSLVVGLAQVLALLPGTSRSGITMTAGLAQKFSKELAVKFSFLISVPVVFLSGIWGLYQLWSTGFSEINLSLIIIGFVTSFLGGVIAIKLIFAWLKDHNFTIFVIYRIALGIGLLIFL